MSGSDDDGTVEGDGGKKWLPNSKALSCMLCHKPFGWFRHRHHCRQCGNIFCNACSSRRAHVVGIEGRTRVCLRCYDVLATPAAPSVNTDTPVSPRKRDGSASGGMTSAFGAPYVLVAPSPNHHRLRVHDHEISYVCDDALLPTTRVVRRLSPALQWFFGVAQPAWRWTSCAAPATIAVYWFIVWHAPWLAVSLACFSALLLVLSEKAIMVLVPFVPSVAKLTTGVDKSWFRLSKRPYPAAVAQQKALNAVPEASRPAVRRLYALCSLLADYLDSWYIVSHWMFPNLTHVVLTFLVVGTLLPFFVSPRAFIAAGLLLLLSRHSLLVHRTADWLARTMHARTWRHRSIPRNLERPHPATATATASASGEGPTSKVQRGEERSPPAQVPQDQHGEERSPQVQRSEERLPQQAQRSGEPAMTLRQRRQLAWKRSRDSSSAAATRALRPKS